MKYEKEIKITKKLANKINHLLTEVNEDFGEDLTITKTAVFDNGFEMDIKCCGCRNDVAWTEAVLFRNGSEVACTEPCDEFIGVWECTNDKDSYIVNIVVDESEVTT